MRRRIIGAAACASLAAAAVASAATAAHHAASLPVLKIAESKGTLKVTGTPKAGATELQITTDLPPKHGNTGASIGLIRLKPGVTPQQFAAGIKPDGSNVAQFGSIQTTVDLSKGQTLRVQTVLKRAQYVIGDLNSPPSSTAHTVITVASSSSPAALPEPGATVKMSEYRFRGPGVVRRGELVRTVNAGHQQHMAITLKVPKGMTAKQIEALLRKGKDSQVQRKIRQIGFLIDDVSPGAVNQSRVTLSRGTWVLACFMTNKKGVGHTRLGMEKTLVVK